MRALLPVASAVLFVAGGCAGSTGPSEEALTLEVAAETQPCIGEMRQRCLQVRAPGDESWRLFYEPIMGFEHVEGVRYLLEVARRPVEDPPADGSSFTYRLVRVIERDPAESGAGSGGA